MSPTDVCALLPATLCIWASRITRGYYKLLPCKIAMGLKWEQKYRSLSTWCGILCLTIMSFSSISGSYFVLITAPVRLNMTIPIDLMRKLRLRSFRWWLRSKIQLGLLSLLLLIYIADQPHETTEGQSYRWSTKGNALGRLWNIWKSIQVFHPSECPSFAWWR